MSTLRSVYSAALINPTAMVYLFSVISKAEINVRSDFKTRMMAQRTVWLNNS